MPTRWRCRKGLNVLLATGRTPEVWSRYTGGTRGTSGSRGCWGLGRTISWVLTQHVHLWWTCRREEFAPVKNAPGEGVRHRRVLDSVISSCVLMLLLKAWRLGLANQVL